ALKSSTNYIVAVMYCLVLLAPLSLRAYAQEAPLPPEEPVCVAPAGTRSPTGAAASTYTYNCDSGLWENPYYTWDSITSATTPKQSPEHVFNSEQNRWEVFEWVF